MKESWLIQIQSPGETRKPLEKVKGAMAFLLATTVTTKY